MKTFRLSSLGFTAAVILTVILGPGVSHAYADGLLVTSFATNSVLRYNVTTGSFYLRRFGAAADWWR